LNRSLFTNPAWLHASEGSRPEIPQKDLVTIPSGAWNDASGSIKSGARIKSDENLVSTLGDGEYYVVAVDVAGKQSGKSNTVRIGKEKEEPKPPKEDKPKPDKPEEPKPDTGDSGGGSGQGDGGADSGNGGGGTDSDSDSGTGNNSGSGGNNNSQG